MSTSVIDLIASSKSYVQDDHAAVQGAIGDDTWLRWLNVEWKQLYRRLCREGMVDPAASGETLTLPSDTIDDAEGIICVVEQTGLDQRILRPSQPTLGRMHLTQSNNSGTALFWSASSGAAGGITVTLNPPPTSGLYVAYFIPTPPKLVVTVPVNGETDTLYLPAGSEDRLCLGAARRALARGRGASGALMALIKEADEELSFAASARLSQNGNKVRNVDWFVRGWQPRGQEVMTAFMNRSAWIWF